MRGEDNGGDDDDECEKLDDLEAQEEEEFGTRDNSAQTQASSSTRARKNRSRDDTSSCLDLVWTLHQWQRTRGGLLKNSRGGATCLRDTARPHVRGRREGGTNVGVLG